MRVITIGQRKGGNGKTTSALNLAYAYAELGAKVLLIDLDDQKNSTSAIDTPTPPTKTVEDLLLDPSVTVAEAAAATTWPGVSLVASSPNLSGAIRALDAEVGGHEVLGEKLRACDEFNIVLIDTSPSLNILVLNALCASHWLLIPLSSKYFSLQGLEQTLEAYHKVKKRLHPSLQLLGMAFVIHDKRSSLACEVVEKARQAYPQLVCEKWVGLNIKIEEAQVSRQSILGYATGDRGAAQYRALALELACRMKIPGGSCGDGEETTE